MKRLSRHFDGILVIIDRIFWEVLRLLSLLGSDFCLEFHEEFRGGRGADRTEMGMGSVSDWVWG